MSDQEKKVEVRFGAFACTIEGYDNPVEQLQEVLGLMQKMIADTPALAASENSFDPKPIQEALDGDDAPGIVVIRNDDATDTEVEATSTEADAVAATTDVVEEAANLSDDTPLSDAPQPVETTDVAEQRGTAADLVEDLADHTAAAVAPPDENTGSDEPEGSDNDFGSLAQGAAAVAAAGAVYLGSQAAAEDTETPGFPLDESTSDTAPESDVSAGELPSMPDAAASDADLSLMSEHAEEAQQFAAAAPVETEPDIDPTTTDMSTEPLQAASGMDTDLDALAAELDVVSEPVADDALDQFAEALADAPEDISDAVAPTPEPENIFGSLDTEVADTEPTTTGTEPTTTAIEPEPEAEQAETAQLQTAVADEVTPEPVNIFGAPQTDPVEPQVETEPELEPEPEQPAAASEAAREPVNIFGAPRTEPLDELAPSAPSSPNIFAAPAAATASAFAPAAELASEDAAEEIAALDPEPIVEPEPELAPNVAEEQPAVGDTAAPLTSIFAPPPQADKVRDLGADLSGATADLNAQADDQFQSSNDALEQVAADTNTAPAHTDPAPENTADIQSKPQDDEVSQFRSIFAPPPEPAADPAPASPAVDEVAPPAGNSRFEDLLSRVHGATTMSAPGESPVDQPAEPLPPTNQTDTGLTSVAAVQFAQASKANTVAEQLAASAAWLTLAKGQSRFTRREVMAVLETIPSNEPRELADRIKGFGKLVRSGTLVLIDDGVFAMAQGERDRFKSLLP